MTGDQNDLISRLQRWLPDGWFPTQAGTRIYAILAGLASLFSTLYAWVLYLQLQTRIATSTDGFLDLASADFFGSALPRLTAESDALFSGRIRREVVRDRQTRNAIDALLFEMTGQHPTIVELGRPKDCFAFRGQYGLRAPNTHLSSRAGDYAVFITTVSAGVFGIPKAGLRNPNMGLRTPNFVCSVPAMITGTGFTNAQMLDALDRIRPAGITYWVHIT